MYKNNISKREKMLCAIFIFRKKSICSICSFVKRLTRLSSHPYFNLSR